MNIEGENCSIETLEKVDERTSLNPLKQHNCNTDDCIKTEPKSYTDEESEEIALATSASIVMKVLSVLAENSSAQFIDDISLALCRSGKLCEHQHSSDNAISSKNADNRESLPSHEECKSLRAMSTFICGGDIDARKMKIRREITDGEDITENLSLAIMTESPSKLRSDSSKIEVFKHMEKLDD